ncbi:MAG: site-2 protease family protein [Candidatus Acetothermia bacterium]|nr:site-2 protease family protein [Candidatus Acetothermia bacterium]MDH7505828.1 site-2 protease family protein [Candidatus Acetothermia bacterium]
MTGLAELIPELAVVVLAAGLSIILHEVAHGWVAYRLGDPTAKLAGRLTLNPLAHIDPVGTLLVPGLLLLLATVTKAPIILFGWARPVPINPLYFRRPYRDLMLVGLAGPLLNLSLAGLGLAAWQPLSRSSQPLPELLGLFLAALILINLILAFYNLIPIPPLDGSRVLAYFLPPRGRMLLHRLEPFGLFLALGVLFLLWQSKLLERLLEPLLRFLGLGP